jgi:DNA phosphorothioation-associated putative methyltransferase
MSPNEGILRHRTAIARTSLSRPILQCLVDQVLRPGKSLLDFGCGRGVDVQLLGHEGYAAEGWDPVYRPDQEKRPADVVNLGYVINVIEDIGERESTLMQAYSLARECLVVAAQLSYQVRVSAGETYADGIVTRRNTFQKYFSQDELRGFIEETLGDEAIPAAPGIFYVFRNAEARQAFLLRKVARRRTAVPRRIISIEERLAPHRTQLQAFAEQVELLGRLPRDSEFPDMPALRQAVGTPRRCVTLCGKLFEGFQFEEFRARRREDLLTYIALSRFRRRPQFGALPQALKWDIRDLFGSYSRACDEADSLLFAAGDAERINAACESSKLGKLLPTALYVHQSAESDLSPILRVYLGCGRAFIGDVAGANLLKLHRFTGKISYLSYPSFDSEAHPALERSLTINLRTRDVHERVYMDSTNPPILHRKETFVLRTYPGYEAFAGLTREEEAAGLLDSTDRIGFRQQWLEALATAGYCIEGHSLQKRPTEPLKEESLPSNP